MTKFNAPHPVSPAANAPICRVVPMMQGWEWIKGAWALFKANSLGWISTVLLGYLLIMLLNLLPFIGTVVAAVLTPILWGGLFLGAYAQDQGKTQNQGWRLRPGFLFAARQQRGALVIVGVVDFLLLILSLFIMASLITALLAEEIKPFFLDSLKNLFLPSNNDDVAQKLQQIQANGYTPSQASSIFLLGTYLMLGCMAASNLIVLTVQYFAPCLIVLHGVRPIRAMQLSVIACLKNWRPFLLCGLIFLLASFSVLLTFGLSLVVILPMMFAVNYIAFRDIFPGEIPPLPTEQEAVVS